MEITFKFFYQYSSHFAMCILLGSCSSRNEIFFVETPGGSFISEENRSNRDSTKAEWWTLFRSEELNQLMRRIDSDNFQVQAGLARIDRANAVLGGSLASLVPGIIASQSVKETRISENDLGGKFFQNQYQHHRAALALNWEIDFWGRVRSAVRGAKMDARQEGHLVAALRLSLQSQLAQNYFKYHFLNEERSVLLSAIEARKNNFELAKSRLTGKVGSELDVALAESELESVRVELASLEGPRKRLEHAIAVLVGSVPTDFRLMGKSSKIHFPEIHAGYPMSVLEKRPDVAAAIARLESANARIGVAKAEFFPRINLVGSGGLSSINSSDFFDWSSRTYGLGPEVTLPIFQGGKLKANLKKARANQAEALADYQQTVLVALGELEDALSDLKSLRAELEAQTLAVQAADRALQISQKRHKQGLVDSIEVLDALRGKLNAKRREVRIRSSQYEKTVVFFHALGGEW